MLKVMEAALEVIMNMETILGDALWCKLLQHNGTMNLQHVKIG